MLEARLMVFFFVICLLGAFLVRTADDLMGIDFKDKPRYLAFIHRFMYIMVGVGMTALYAYLSNL